MKFEKLILVSDEQPASPNLIDISKKYIDDWGNFASVLGLIITIITCVTAERARRAAKKAIEAVTQYNTSMKISGVISKIEEVKSLHRESENINILPDKYNSIRRNLIAVKATNSNLDSDSKLRLQNAVSQIKIIETDVEKAIEEGINLSNIAKINKIFSDIIDDLEEVLQKSNKDFFDYKK